MTTTTAAAVTTRATRRRITESTNNTAATSATYGEPTATNNAMLFGSGTARTNRVKTENANTNTASRRRSVLDRVRRLPDAMGRPPLSVD